MSVRCLAHAWRGAVSREPDLSDGKSGFRKEEWHVLSLVEELGEAPKVPSHCVHTGEAEGHSNMQGLLATPQNHCV